MKRTEELTKIREAKKIIADLRVKGFLTLKDICKKHGKIGIKPTKFKGVTYPIVSVYVGRLKGFLSDTYTDDTLIAVINRGNDDGGIVRLPTHIDLMANMRNTESMYELIEMVEEKVGE